MKSASNDKRLERLENLLAPPEKKGSPPIDPDFLAIWDEVEGMDWWKNVGHANSYRGSPNGLVQVQSRDIAYEHYGRDYTDEEELELAVRTALQKRGHPEEDVDELTEVWMETYPRAMENLAKQLEAHEAEERERGEGHS